MGSEMYQKPLKISSLVSCRHSTPPVLITCSMQELWRREA